MAKKNIHQRVVFPPKQQRDFLEQVLKKQPIKKVAEICGISERTVRAWLQEKYTMDFTAFQKLCRITKIGIPHGKNEKQYASFLKTLIQKLFQVPISLTYIKNDSTIRLVVSRKQLVTFCNQRLGLKIGNKLKQGLDIPPWVRRRVEFQKACLRGLIDTDGCIFYERHKIKNKIYSYPRLNFVSYSPSLRNSVYNIFKDLGMSPRMRGDRSVQLEDAEEIRRYFKIVGTHNLKNTDRYNKQ